MSDNYKRTDVSKDTIEYTITIPSKNFEESYSSVLKDHTKDLDMKGFRKGQVPEDIIKTNMGDTIKYETFEKLAPLYVNTTLMKEKVNPIVPPAYKEIPQIEAGKDIVFTVIVTVMPEFKLGNLKKIKVEKKEIKVDDKEVDSSIEELKKTQKTGEMNINDTWAKEVAKNIGLEKINSLEDLKKLIKDSLKGQKEHLALHEYQDKIWEEAVKISKIQIPDVAVKYEASERENTFIYEMKQRGVDIKDFLKTQNITIEKMREMWEKDAKEALEADTLLNIYAKEKSVSISEDELNKKIEEIKKGQGDARNDIYSNPQWREYVKNVETKTKAFNMLMEEVLGEKWDHKD